MPECVVAEHAVQVAADDALILGHRTFGLAVNEGERAGAGGTVRPALVHLVTGESGAAWRVGRRCLGQAFVTGFVFPTDHGHIQHLVVAGEGARHVLAMDILVQQRLGA